MDMCHIEGSVVAEDLGVQKILQTRYSFSRIQWLIGTVSVSSLLYLTTEEIWKIVDAEPFPEVTSQGFIYYATFFLLALILVHYFDTKRIVQRRSVAIAASLISISIDLCIISLSELMTLYAIQVLPQNYLEAIMTLLIGAMPASLGSIVLSSLTAENLKKRAKKLYEEAQDIGKQIAELENQGKIAMKRLKLLEKRKREFQNYFKKQAIGAEDRGVEDGE